jgi:hypothetical protein
MQSMYKSIQPSITLWASNPESPNKGTEDLRFSREKELRKSHIQNLDNFDLLSLFFVRSVLECCTLHRANVL